MFGWLTENKALFEALIHYDAFRLGSLVMYGLFCAAIFKIGVTSHYEKAMGHENPLVYPKGYFSMLAVSLIPLVFTGLARQDEYLMSTRLTTLVCVLFAYAAVANETGVFNWKHIRSWIASAFIVIMAVPVLWQDMEFLRTFVSRYDTALGWVSVGFMFLFMFFGQRITAREMVRRIVKGDYQLKGFGLQVVRFFAFFLQAVHYGYVYGLGDPVFIQGTMGAIGVTGVVGVYIWGLFKRGFSGGRASAAAA